MLSSFEVTSASRAKDYFATSVSPEAIGSRRDYYSEGQESPGTYSGKLADTLKLTGKTVDQETFHRLCDNLHPTEDRPLTPRTNDYRRVCYDFTFAGPKSFSIIEAFASEADRRELRRIFDEAVGETVAEDIEPDMQCRERAGGADYNILTGNVLTVGFDHATARPLSAKEFAEWLAVNDNLMPGGAANDNAVVPDMHWHKHLLVWNATQRPDNRIMAGQFGNIIRDKPFYRAAFYARLASKLEGLGYAIDRRGDTDWEIAGISQSMIDKFSKRTALIEAEAEKRGITDEAEKAELGAKLRGKKLKDLKMPELRKAWDAQLTDDERDALAAVYRREASGSAEVTAAEAVAFAIDHLSEKLSVFPERELKRVALLHGLGQVTPGQVAAELPRQGVITAEIDGRRMATTPGLQREEDYLVGQAMGGRGSVAAVGLAEGLSRELEGGKRLNDGQWDAACGLLNSENRVNLVEGPAGAGKTELLKKFDEGVQRAGQRVTWLATTADAAGVLAEKGFKANTVARFLLDPKLQQSARGGRVGVDETSLLGHKDAVKLMRLAEKLDLKLIFVGDPMQHGAVDRGAFMRILAEYGGVKPFRLTEIMRQENPEYRAAAKLLSEGKTVEGFDAIDAMGRVEEIADATDRYRHIAIDYVQALKDKKSVLVVSPTHAEAKAITAAIRSELRAAKRLGEEDEEFTRLVPVDTSEAERRQASTYRAGPLVAVFHQNAKGGFTKGDRLTITDPAQVPLEHADKFSLYRPETISLAVKDKIRITGNVKTLDGKHTLKNGMTRSIGAFGANSITLDNGWVIPADAGHFRHGFVETSFGSQGKTVQRVILGMAAASVPAMNMEQLYVSASRAKQWIRLYTDDKEEIRDAVKRSSRKLAALDLRPKPEPLFDSTSGMKRQMEHRRRQSVIGWMRAAAERAMPRQKPNERQVDYGYGR
jgi:conjugative relaxase-like TrwC/TraI family protein